MQQTNSKCVLMCSGAHCVVAKAHVGQVMANLANFAYDPAHHAHLLELNCVELFLDALEDSDRDTVSASDGSMSVGGSSVCVRVRTFN